MPEQDKQDLVDGLAAELAAVLEDIIRYPRHSHPGYPAVSYEHRSVKTHERALDVLRRYRENAVALRPING